MKDKIGDLEISFRTQARGERNEVEAELAGVEETLRSQQDRVSRTLARSPVKGEVKQVKVTTIGGVIRPGIEGHRGRHHYKSGPNSPVAFFHGRYLLSSMAGQSIEAM